MQLTRAGDYAVRVLINLASALWGAVVRRVEMMIAACRRHGKIPGLLVQDVSSAKEWIARGIRLVPYSNEVSLLITASARAIGEIRSYAKQNR